MQDTQMNNTQKSKKVYLYVLDTMADWEIGYLTAELNSGRFYRKGISPSKIVTVGITKAPVTTMGGLHILPDITVEELDMNNMAALILPGGDTWMEPLHLPIINKVKQCIKENIVVAAICGATMALAQNGLLNLRWHTSNDLAYLKMVCPGYSGEKYYKNEPVVTDGNLITAPWTAPLEFARDVLKALDVFSPETLELWYKLINTKEAKYFPELMDSIQ